ncbi:hypothetical protein [Stackebrandtia nassauensis]|uniref:Uncharacterized protein n=1 Tax=Stackebrandtia nassauensis (strain DSM 44728 / CIP 108903 / NRRL B-16338 / NBRC 102104 / LLR-40K-21) TaxID=446470 RepID=D3Q244_STANL|nr:hypothetical protein [Stackebrandtia nassauensis]ADD41911.1 hypothetical protein Snas_2221 [Stackebrandtia nassauensis DSM 44728]
MNNFAAPEPHQYSITKTRKQTNHTFHLLMTILTCSAWAFFVWFPVILWNKLGPKPKIVTKHQ